MIHSLVQQWMWRSLGWSLEAQRSHHLQYLLTHQVLLHIMCWRNPLCLEDILITEFLEMVKIEQNMKDWFYTMPTGSSRRRPPSAWVPSIIIVAHPRCVQPWIHFHWLFERQAKMIPTQSCKTLQDHFFLLTALLPSFREVPGLKEKRMVLYVTLFQSPRILPGDRLANFWALFTAWIGKTCIPGGVVAVRGVIASGSSPIQGGSG